MAMREKQKALLGISLVVIIQEEREEVDPGEKYANNNIRDWIRLSLGAAIRKTDRE